MSMLRPWCLGLGAKKRTETGERRDQATNSDWRPLAQDDFPGTQERRSDNATRSDAALEKAVTSEVKVTMISRLDLTMWAIQATPLGRAIPRIHATDP